MHHAEQAVPVTYPYPNDNAFYAPMNSQASLADPWSRSSHTTAASPAPAKSGTTTDFLQSDLLSPWRDPISGITSHLLTPAGTPTGNARLAELQLSFYYTNPSLWLQPGLKGQESAVQYWFFCVFPPSEVRMLAVADFSSGTMRIFPDSALKGSGDHSPMLHPDTGEVYWATSQGIWKRSADASKRPEHVNAFEPSFIGNRLVASYATHLTLDAEKTTLGIDARIGDETYIGHAPLDGGAIEIWHSEEQLYNHAQCNPRHSGLILLAQENYTDPNTGRVRYKDNRLWLAQRSQPAAGRPVFFPVYPHSLAHLVGTDYRPVTSNPHLELMHQAVRSEPRQMHGHEWWSADGNYIYYIHYQTGVERIPLSAAGTETALPELVWPHTTVSHAHSSPCGNYLVLDALPPDQPEQHHVRFVNLRTRRTVDIVSRMPVPPPCFRKYHLHAHPCFCGPHGEYIRYNKIQDDGSVDSAFVRVSDLVDAT